MLCSARSRALLVMAIPMVFASLAGAADSFTVYTGTYPLQYFAERIAGEHAAVVFPAPADVDPAFWTPDHRTIAAYQQADLILLNGAGYEKWASKVSLPQARVVDTSRGFRDRYILADEKVTHSHGAGGEHEHSNIAFTTWLDLSLAQEQARAIAKALEREVPNAASTFRRNLAALESELSDLDKRLREIGNRDPSKPLVGSHPVYQYLAKRYALNVRYVHWEPDEIPSAVQWQELKEVLASHPAKAILWEEEPRAEVSAQLQDLGLRSVVFNPCASTPRQGSFLEVIQMNIEHMDAAY